jgi:hypothetical protein
MLHSFRRRKVKGGFVAMKIDLQKAYDRVNWSFFRAVLKSFGFQEKFSNWIMQCVTTVSFSVLTNGGKSKSFQPTRGIRQGDPLSPYLFVLCQEVLSRLIDKELVVGNINGVRMNVGGPAFTHVMYANDIILFAKANCREVKILDACIEKYCLWSGQAINRDKSSLFFSKMVQGERKRMIKHTLQMKNIQQHATYLGAPLFTSRNRCNDFKFLQEKLDARLRGWRSKTLSWVGHNTLIKSVANALPTYTFSTFDVPNKVCDKLDASTRRFWWNPKKDHGRFLAWKSWEHLCLPKRYGGLGFRKSKNFNEALISKLTWMVLTKRDSLCINALRSKYKVDDGWLHMECKQSASQTWKAIDKMKNLIALGACFLIGDGARIDIWKDPWVPWLPNYLPTPRGERAPNRSLVIACLINQVTRSWNIGMLKELFTLDSVNAILKIPIPQIPRPDKLAWIVDPKGLFSVKSAVRTQQSPNIPTSSDSMWSNFWKLKLHERVKVLIWRIGLDIIPTNLNVARKIGHGVTSCPLYNLEDESVVHLFFNCEVAKAIWFGQCWGVFSDQLPISSCTDIIKLINDL